MTKIFLDTAYTAQDPDSVRDLYNNWAASYEAEIANNGYATPARCAAALAEFADDTSTPMLDFGCGTGLAGLAFKQSGFELIDGVDLSEAMITQAQAKKIYRNLTLIDAETKPEDGYQLMAAVGVIGVGAAPLSTLDVLMYALPSGGKLVFSFNDQTLADPSSTARLNEWLDCGAARLLFSEHGAHLPGHGMNATVYVVEKA